jgi:predicted Rossmann-fold nucleotide-binding protein
MNSNSAGNHHPAIRPRRLFVSGGSKLSPNAAHLWQELGALLAAEDGLIVVTGGLKQRADSPKTVPSDWAIVKGMLGALKRRRANSANHIETMLPDRSRDWRKLQRFRKGRVQILPKRTAQSRRFSMVSSSDVVISIEGEEGTRSVLDMALAIEKPILPLPFGDGVSANRWKEHRREILEKFHLSRNEAARWGKIKLERLSESEIATLARSVKRHLLTGFTRNCFVIMPFRRKFAPVYEQAIKPALADHGLKALRTDRLGLTGNVVQFIRNALNSCYFSIADTTHDRPNVMYELGMAHAENKTVILLRSAKDRPPPFDIQNENIIKYTQDMKKLRAELYRIIAVLLGKADSLDHSPRKKTARRPPARHARRRPRSNGRKSPPSS